MIANRKKLGAVSLALVAVLVCSVIFNLFYAGTIDFSNLGETGATVSDAFEAKAEKVDIDVSALQKAYFNQNVVQALETEASYTGKRWVIVELEGDDLYDGYEKNSRFDSFNDYCNSRDGLRLLEKIEAEQAAFIDKLNMRGIDYDYKYSYTSISNGVAIKVSADDYNAIKQMSGVKGVYYSERYSIPQYTVVTNETNKYTTGIYDSSDLKDYNDASYQGEGMVVAILDTGLDRTHEAFDPEGMNEEKLRWTKDTMRAFLEENATKSGDERLAAMGTVDDLFYSNKVPFAYDYADDDNEVFPAYSSHGTHVAGIVAGRKAMIDSNNTPKNPDDDIEFIGVAPEAQLVICKVFTDDLDSDMLGGADSIDILRAINDCVILGVDAINMSLGTAAGFADESSDEYLTRIYNRVEAAGISLVCAASNDFSSGFGGGNGTNLASNPDSGTVGAPSTYASALSVASINGQESDYFLANPGMGEDGGQVAFFTNASDGKGNEIKFIDKIYEKLGRDSGRIKLKYVFIDGVGESNDYSSAVSELRLNSIPQDCDGVVVFVKRGTNTFEDKVNNAMMKMQAIINSSNKVAACVIYNNVSGTIRMSLGNLNDPIPTCSITMDAANEIKKYAVYGVGTMEIDKEFKAGPFMSDFSSWGPTPDLQLKPEISAHGGEITSAVAGDGYDVYSGTSMASPNMAGAIALLRQYIKQTNPGINGSALNALVNQRLMSTATLAMNEENNPYSPRKQGAGLASIYDAIRTEGYITVDDANGDERDKTKIELYDDPTKQGVYSLKFTVHNISGEAQTYTKYTYVLTETMASDDKTVAEKAYRLEDMCDIVYYTVDNVGNKTKLTGDLTVSANETVDVLIEITLKSEARAYLDANFVNGMYVEGFVRLYNKETGRVTLGLPYLAFYGDWTAAPMFDYDIYELAESQNDTNVPLDSKLKASAAETRVLGLYDNDQYILPLGQYIYSQPETDTKMYVDRERASISRYDIDGRMQTVYELYMVYAGLLRNAAEMEIVITEAVTGEEIYRENREYLHKSYAAGGSARGSSIMLELNPGEWNLQNNVTYNVSLKGKLDYDTENRVGPDRTTFDFQFTVDYEAPQLLDYRIAFERSGVDKDGNVQYKNVTLYMDVYDNHFLQAILPCYTVSHTTGDLGNYLQLLTEYPIYVESPKASVYTTSLDITKFYEDYVKNATSTKSLYINMIDYALNSSTYQITLDREHIDYPESVTFDTSVDERLTLDAQATAKNNYSVYNLYSLQPNELFTLNAFVEPAGSLIQTLEWDSSNSACVIAKDNEIFARSAPERTGSIKLRLRDKDNSSGRNQIYAEVNVWVSGEPLDEPLLKGLEFKPIINGDDYLDWKKGDTIYDRNAIKLNPNQEVKLEIEPTPWYLVEYKNPDMYTWKSTSQDITVDQQGNIKAVRTGGGTISAQVKSGTGDSVEIDFTVGEEFYVNNYTLYDYFGGPEVIVPDRLNVMYIDENCFKNNTTITRVVLPSSLTEIPKFCFEGCINLQEVVIPGHVTVIGEYAFSSTDERIQGTSTENKRSNGYLEKLEKVTFENFVDANQHQYDKYPGSITVGRGAFKNCTALATIENEQRMTTMYDNAFEGCTSLTNIDITKLRVAGRGVFRNSGLQSVTTSPDTLIGEYMFENCTELHQFDFKGSRVPEGTFNGCSNLDTITFSETPYGELLGIGRLAFAGTKVSQITLPNGTYMIGENAFRNTPLATVTLSERTKLMQNSLTPFSGCTSFTAYALSGTSEYYEVQDGVLYSKTKDEIVSVPVAKSVSGSELLGSVTKIGPAAYAGVTAAMTFDLNAKNIASIGSYAFAGSGISTVTLPDGMEELAEGVFYACPDLTTVNGSNALKKVGASAFRNTRRLTTIDLAAATDIGDYAFAGSAIATLANASNIQKVGNGAFMESNLTQVNMPSLTQMGDMAFAEMQALTSVTVGTIGKGMMGNMAFANSDLISTVTFGRDSYIGEMAFVRTQHDEDYGVDLPTRCETMMTVNFNGSVKEIGAFAFYYHTGIQNLNLTGVEYIGSSAFDRCGSLAQISGLESVIHIDEYAFAETGFANAELNSVKILGYGAFMDSKLANVTMPKVERIGARAFAGSKLTRVTLPATLAKGDGEETASRTYKYHWIIYDHKNRIEDEKDRNELKIGEGAFANIPTLTAINVESNDIFQSIDGVLYSHVANGLVLEQYPAGKTLTEFTPAAHTVSIQANAFEGNTRLNKVTIPYTVKQIGNAAFINTNIGEYVFEGVDAPELLTAYDDNVFFLVMMLGSLSYLAPGNGENYYPTNFYSNFRGYAILVDARTFDSDVLPSIASAWVQNGLGGVAPNTQGLGGVTYGLTADIPVNGRGYDKPVWDLFFEHIQQKTLRAEDQTHKAIEAISAIPTIEQINAVSNANLSDYTNLLKIARNEYNLVSNDTDQQNLIKTNYDALVAAEQAFRAAKKANLGISTLVKEIRVKTPPVKRRYDAGERFDKTGMTLAIVYEDDSIDISDDFTWDKQRFAGDDNGVLIISYRDADGIVHTLEYMVNVNPGDVPNEEEEGDNKTTIVAVAVSVPLAVLAIAAIAVVLAIALKKKKSAKKDVGGEGEAQKNADNTDAKEAAPENASEPNEMTAEETQEIAAAENAEAIGEATEAASDENETAEEAAESASDENVEAAPEQNGGDEQKSDAEEKQ